MKKFLRNANTLVVLSTLTTQIVFANNTSSLKNQQDSLEQQIKAAEENVKEAKESKEQVLAELEVAEAEVAKANNELEAINGQVRTVKAELEQAEVAYQVATEKKEKQYEDLKARISFMYEFGDVGYTQVLFESEDISDFFKRVEYINTIIKHDKEILTKYEETQKEIDAEIQVISEKKSQIETLQAQQKAKATELEAKQANKEKALAKINKDIEAQEDVIYTLEKENAQIEAMIKEAQRKAAASGTKVANPYTGGQLGWPAPEYTRFSSDYKQRINPVTGKNQWHAGIDLATPYGSSIVAAEDGVVIGASYMSGYGNTVIIDHGNGLSTLYGHNSSLTVNVGDTVTKGQRIANAGSTGNSTGNHCHFEVRINGAHQDPKSYLGM